MKEFIQDIKEAYNEDPMEFVKEAILTTTFFAMMMVVFYAACWLDQNVLY